MKKITAKLCSSISLLLGSALSVPLYANLDTNSPLYSLETQYTISKVRTANLNSKSSIIASSHEGTILAFDYSGNQLWKNELSGYMNHDIWAQDITGDGNAEVMAANADGHLYCLSDKGDLLWSFKPSDTPMYSTTVINHKGKPYIVAGGYDTNFYYLDPKGKLVKTIKSADYSIEKARENYATKDNPAARAQPATRHTVNFLRPLKQADGTEHLFLQGVVNSMQGPGSLYVFKSLADKPFIKSKVKATRSPTGDLITLDVNGDGNEEVLMGSTKMQSQGIVWYDPTSNKQKGINLKKLHKRFSKFGYRIAQTAHINYQGKSSIFILYGNDIGIIPAEMNPKLKPEIITGKYAYNDMWHDKNSNKIVLASAQSGGSNIHVLDIHQAGWQDAFANLTPSGKISEIIANVDDVNQKIKNYKERKYSHQPRPVYLMSDYRQTDKDVVKQVTNDYSSPIFLDYGDLGTEKWDRSAIPNKAYREKRDKRKKYDLSQDQIIKKAKKLYKGPVGAAYWGGHGNDPYFRSLDTHKKVIEVADGRKSVMIFPEVAKYDKDFEVMLTDLMFPLAEHSQKTNTNIFLRNKHIFWQSMIYKPGWKRLIDGEFPDVFIPAMEETTDKSMELSVAARVGLWASGAVNNWGTRLARDNTSFDRLRQHSHQMLPNHALRQYIYNVANGATYINNFIVDQDHIKTLWDLIGKGVLYVPKPSDIVSFSPVNIGMLEPDNLYLDEGSSVKTTSLFDQKFEDANKMVFSRLNGSWPGAPLTEWDFSRYAADEKERRLNFLPSYPNGLVLITPPQDGVNADKNAPRGKLVDHLHPIYKNIMTEFYTDGRDYVSKDGKNRYAADQYYKQIAQTIKEKSKLLPITVTGGAAWVVAQTSPTNLRLTLVDEGYINPAKSIAKITFNTIKPVKVTDVINGHNLKLDNQTLDVEIPTGLFRFIDVTLAKPL